MRGHHEVDPDEKPERSRHDWPLPTDYPSIIPFSEILRDEHSETEEKREIETLLVQSADERR